MSTIEEIWRWWLTKFYKSCFLNLGVIYPDYTLSSYWYKPLIISTSLSLPSIEDSKTSKLLIKLVTSSKGSHSIVVCDAIIKTYWEFLSFS